MGKPNVVFVEQPASREVTVTLSADAATAYAQYLEARREPDMIGEMTLRDLEEVRSYAVEFTRRLLRDNPEVFPEYAAHRKACEEARRRNV